MPRNAADTIEEPVCREFRIFIVLENGIKGSKIVGENIDFHKHLNKWLKPVTGAGSSWKKCYTASKDGWDSHDFHVGCDQRGATVTLVKVGISVFGGYTDREWKCRSIKHCRARYSSSIFFLHIALALKPWLVLKFRVWHRYSRKSS